MKLVICEKPSVGAAVAAALGVTGRKDGYIEGNGYLISWCIGHLVQLSEAAAYEERTGKSWNICLAPKQPKSGVYLKGGYRYFVAKTAYRAFQNWGICG